MYKMAILLHGKPLADNIIAGVHTKISNLLKQGLRAPSLLTIQLGDDPASSLYVTKKHLACQQAGIESMAINLPREVTEDELCQHIQHANNDDNIDGILVQLPLPEHINYQRVINTINPAKDVDGIHYQSVGKLVQGNTTALYPCTPQAVFKLLEHYSLAEFTGKHVVIVGTSLIVGKPLAMMFIHANATVTCCNIYTKDLAKHVKAADILVTAIGRPGVISPAMIAPDACVIDIGINRPGDGKVYGDVDSTFTRKLVKYITPVPGGVGPVTVAALMENTYLAATS